jgi:CheY-like chemotaxis protein
MEQSEGRMTHQNRPVILVVDDDVTIRLLIQDILDDVFYKVMLVADGAAALTAMETVVPDLVTLDLDMPGIHGGQVLELIRQKEHLRDVKVVIISSATLIAPRVKELAQAILQKPFDIDDLLDVIQRLAPPPKPQGSNETGN